MTELINLQTTNDMIDNVMHIHGNSGTSYMRHGHLHYNAKCPKFKR